MRIRSAEGHVHYKPPGPEEWLLCEWPLGEPRPTKFWLSPLPASAPRRTRVRLAKLRWRVERDYQDLKQEVELDHFEGRSWRGLHHHATLCAVAHGFLALHRALFPLSQTPWTLQQVRRYLLLHRLGYCPLCRRPIDVLPPPSGPPTI